MSNRTVNSATKLINIESGAYPVYLTQVRQENPNTSFGAEPDEDQMLALGYAVVLQVDKPAGDVVTEGPPEGIDGEYIQNWIVREFTPEEKAANLQVERDKRISAVEKLFVETLDKGTPYTWPSGATESIQLRDGDRANLTAIGARADRQISRGVTEDPWLIFITYENNTQSLTPEQARDMTDFAYEAYLTLLNQRRALKTEMENATTMEDLPAVPEAFVQYTGQA